LYRKSPPKNLVTKALNTRGAMEAKEAGRLEEGILALSPPSRVYCENAFGTRLMLMVQGGKISRSWLRESSRGMQNKQLVQRDRATARWGRGERSCKAHNFPSRNTTLVNSSANGKALTSLGAPRIAMSAFHSARRYGVSRLL